MVENASSASDDGDGGDHFERLDLRLPASIAAWCPRASKASSRRCVTEGPMWAASPEVDEDDNAGDCRVGAPHRGEGVTLDRIDNKENGQVRRSKDNHHPDL